MKYVFSFHMIFHTCTYIYLHKNFRTKEMFFGDLTSIYVPTDFTENFKIY